MVELLADAMRTAALMYKRIAVKVPIQCTLKYAPLPFRVVGIRKHDIRSGYQHQSLSFFRYLTWGSNGLFNINSKYGN